MDTLKKNWILIFLVIIAVPFFLINTYTNFYQPLISVSNGNEIDQLDFEVFMWSVDNFLDEPHSLYSTPESIGTRWYIYPPPSIIMFLPFKLIPAPYNYFVYKLFLWFCFVFSGFLIYKLISDKREKSKLKNTAYFIIVSSFSTVFFDLKTANVNSIVLFFAVLSFYLFIKNQNSSSFLVYAYSFWVKLYTIFLFPLYINFKDKKRITMLLAALILIPLASFLFTPFDMYTHYFFEHIQAFANHPQSNSVVNQSFINFIQFFSFPSDYFAEYNISYIPKELSFLNLLVLFSLYFSILFIHYNKKIASSKLIVFSSILLLTGMFSVTGWISTYTFALPLLITTFFIIQNEKIHIQVFGFLLIAAFIIPKPTSGVIEKMSSYLNHYVLILVHFRYLLASFLLIALNLYLAYKKRLGANQLSID